MSVSATTVFVNDLTEVLGLYTTNEIKTTIGDSINNNRVPTIRQVIRFLDEIGEFGLSITLEVVYERLKGTLHTNRAVSNFRTDGFDINELLSAVSNASSSVKRSLSITIGNAA